MALESHKLTYTLNALFLLTLGIFPLTNVFRLHQTLKNSENIFGNNLYVETNGA